jgi:hypothetical protein
MMNGPAIRTGACFYWNEIPRCDQLPAKNKHDMPEVRLVRPKKRFALIKPSRFMEATSHTAMGVAVGLAF